MLDVLSVVLISRLDRDWPMFAVVGSQWETSDCSEDRRISWSGYGWERWRWSRCRK